MSLALQTANDNDTASQILESGTVFWIEDTSAGFRKYLEVELKKHKFWKNTPFWKHLVDSQVDAKERDPHSMPMTVQQKTDFVLQCMIGPVHQVCMQRFSRMRTESDDCCPRCFRMANPRATSPSAWRSSRRSTAWTRTRRRR